MTAPLIVLPNSFMATPLAFSHLVPAAGIRWMRAASGTVTRLPREPIHGQAAQEAARVGQVSLGRLPFRVHFSL